jgi:hypothetical protein
VRDLRPRPIFEAWPSLARAPRSTRSGRRRCRSTPSPLQARQRSVGGASLRAMRLPRRRLKPLPPQTGRFRRFRSRASGNPSSTETARPVVVTVGRRTPKKWFRGRLRCDSPSATATGVFNDATMARGAMDRRASDGLRAGRDRPLEAKGRSGKGSGAKASHPRAAKAPKASKPAPVKTSHASVPRTAAGKIQRSDPARHAFARQTGYARQHDHARTGRRRRAPAMEMTVHSNDPREATS